MTKFTRRAAARPAELLEAALTCFHESGFSATKVEAIAQAAGVTAGTIYRYFTSKEQLFRAVVEAHLDAEWSRGRVIAEAYGSSTAREVVGMLLHRWSATLREPGPRRVAVLVFREAPLFPESVQLYEEQLLTRGRLALERALRHGIDRGEFPLLPIEATARSLLGGPLERVLWQETFGNSGEALGEDGDLVELLVRGLPRKDLPPEQSLATGAPLVALDSTGSESITSASGLRITTLRRPSSR